MQIVIVGLGKVGRALTEQLTAEGHDIVAIDNDAELTEDIVNVYDVRGVAGNGACYDVQREAFEDGADLLIATTSSDEINILACLVAKKIGTPPHHRPHPQPGIRAPAALHARRTRPVHGHQPEKATAREIARVLRFPSAIKLEPFCRGRFELIEYRLGPATRWRAWRWPICTATCT